jgi:hypothetical protein
MKKQKLFVTIVAAVLIVVMIVTMMAGYLMM